MAGVFSPLSSSRTTCGSLLLDLQKIWDEIGEGDGERDKMLLQLEQECLEIYRRKVELTRKYKADLIKSVADAESEIGSLVSALGENVSCSRGNGTLKQQLSAVKPVLEDLRSIKQDRMKDFYETQMQIAQIRAEIAGICSSDKFADPQVDENDLTFKRLGELKSHLKELQSEKSLRSQKVNNSISLIHDLTVVMSMDFFETINDVHPSLCASGNGQSKSISNDTFARLTAVIHSLKQEKHQRLQKLQGLGHTLRELWELMDIDPSEQRKWDHVTSLISSTVDEVLKQGSLALEVIEQTELEVERLNVVKTSKLKELIFKRQKELEEIYIGVHMDVDSESARRILTDFIESGVDLSNLLSRMDDQIRKAKEEALSRKDILDKIDRWKLASEEEKWLDEYEKDENRYNAGRGAHKNLKRAEKARILVSKISSIVENLMAKIKAWEAEKGIPFLYESAPLLKTLEEYTLLRQEREEEKRRSREQKRLQEQYAAEQEAIYGSRPSAKKPLGQSTTANTMAGTPGSRRLNTPGRHGLSAGGKERRESRLHNVAPINYVALSKDDSSSRGC